MGSRLNQWAELRVASLLWLVGCSGSGPGNSNGDASASAPSLAGVLIDKRDLGPETYDAVLRGAAESELARARDADRAWLAQASVIDAPFAMSRLGMRWQSDARRIRWQIDERTLSARDVDDGAVLASFAITEHTDSSDSLRPGATQAPTATPTASARPWAQRRLLRVDLRVNRVDRVPLAPGSSQRTLALRWDESQAEERVRFTWSPLGQSMVAFAADTRGVLDVGAVRATDFALEERSLCALSAMRPWECEPTRVSIRWSFSRAEAASPVASRVVDEGFAQTTFVRIDERDGTRAMIAPRLFDDPWQRDPRGARIPVASSHAGAALAEDGAHYHTRPFSERAVVAIPLYVVGESPAYRPAIERAAQQWNAVLGAIRPRAARRECLLSDPPRSDCDAGDGAPDSWRAPLRLCHSPVWGSDPSREGFHSERERASAHAAGWDSDACGAQGTRAELGDGAHHVLAFVDEGDSRIGPLSLFGAKIDGRTHELAAAQILVSNREIALSARSALREVWTLHGAFDDALFADPLREAYRMQPDVIAPDVHGALIDLQNDRLEAQLLPQEQRAIAVADPRASALSESVRELVSPLRMFNSAHFEASRRARAERMRAQCEFVLLPDQTDAASLLAAFERNAPPYGEDFGRAWSFATTQGLSLEVVQSWIESAVVLRAASHGIGHLLGLEHNLAASADVSNFPDAWWIARVSNGDDPRPFLATRYREVERAIRGAGTSSVMDVGSLGSLALGRADDAMIARAQGGLIDAFIRTLRPEPSLALFEHLRFDVALRARPSTHYMQLRASFDATSAQAPDRSIVAPPNLGANNRFWLFDREATHEQPAGSNFESIALNVAGAGPDGRAGSFLTVPYRVARDRALETRWDALVGPSAVEPFEALDERQPQARLEDAYFFGRTSRTASEYVRVIRETRTGPLVTIASLAHEPSRIHAEGWSDWLEAAPTRARQSAARAAIDALFGDLVLFSYDRHQRVARPSDGATYAQRIVERVPWRSNVEGSEPLDSAWVYRDGVAQMAIGGSRHRRTLAAIALSDTLTDEPPSSLRLAPNAMLRALGAIVSEDWEDVGWTGSGFDPRTPPSLFAAPPASESRIEPLLSLDLRQWIAVLWSRSLAQSDPRFASFSHIAREQEVSDARAMVRYRDPTSGAVWLAPHIDGTVLSPSRDPGASGVELRRAERSCPASETPCGAWAALHAERGVSARLLLRAQSVADRMAVSTDRVELAALTIALREANVMIETLRALQR